MDKGFGFLMKKRILFICHRIPYPPNKGEKIRSFNMLASLQGRHDVSLAFLIDDVRDEKYIETVGEYAVRIMYDTIHPFKKLWLVPKVFQRKSISVRYFFSRKLQQQIDAFLDDNEIDYIFCSSSQTAEYVFRSRHRGTTLQKVVKVMDMMDMDSLKWTQYAQSKPWPQSWVYRQEGKNLLRHEKKIAASFDHIFFVSDAECKLFAESVVSENVLSISNGVDLDFFSPYYVSKIPKETPALVFYGAMDYWPNVQAAQWFSDNVFPKIKREMDGAIFYIAGSNPSKELKKLEDREGVVVTGFVEDIRDYIALADICVMPLQIARGIQNKVLEAMAMGKCVVTTSGSFEGISAEPGRDLVVADSAEDFSESVLRLLQDEIFRAKLGGNARAIMEKNYSWPEKLKALHTVVS